ncbi:hypothetical protein FOYG_10007 [Fusarium oxysporum NRRL 32931]|uniref:Uncharacterized protein n=1 Tax=Fusarium oxysporum NRRL 32931 TaxID=660029 RepID=W9I953_FUSOX|nr:hypothetical protein FOYG_10007 [Fusarium oxysporum NRRL 32931]
MMNIHTSNVGRFANSHDTSRLCHNIFTYRRHRKLIPSPVFPRCNYLLNEVHIISKGLQWIIVCWLTLFSETRLLVGRSRRCYWTLVSWDETLEPRIEIITLRRPEHYCHE